MENVPAFNKQRDRKNREKKEIFSPNFLFIINVSGNERIFRVLLRYLNIVLCAQICVQCFNTYLCRTKYIIRWSVSAYF